MARDKNKVRSVHDLKMKISGNSTTKRGVEKAARELIRVRPRTLAYRPYGYGRGNGDWADAIYDLIEISRAADTESLLSVSFRHHRELLMKEGFCLKGKDPRALKVVRKRISEIEAISNRTFRSIVRDVATDLIKFHTAFIYKRRDASRSSGGYVRMFGKRLDPIAALEPVDPTSMQVKQNKSGGITQWRQYIPEQGEEVTFEPDEIICITMDKKTGFVFGTPFCLPVLDDILTLRRIEELVDVVTTKFAFPLLQYKVGTEKSPAQEYSDENGGLYSEVDMVRDTLGELPTEGSIVTPERHEIIVLGAEGNVIDLKPYLEYFKERVMAGLRLGGVEVGQSDSTSKGSATVITKNMTDAVKDYQEELADAISFYLLREILFEEGFDVTDENRVYLKFEPVDQEEKRAKENHSMGLYQGHSITQDEMRDRMDMEPLTAAEQKNGYLHMVEIPLIEFKGKMETDKAKASAAATASKTQPANQHGKKATKTKVKKNDARVEQAWHHARGLVAEGADPTLSAAEGTKLLVELFADELENEIILGAKDQGSVVNSSVVDTFFKKIVKKECRRIEDKVSNMSSSLGTHVPVVSVFDALESVVKRITTRLTVTARAYGMLEAARQADDLAEFGGSRYSSLKDLTIAIASRREQNGTND
ncbi:hypothetical protein DRQ53_14035 [bacterium]|nr:MAG: hypothetical protein DRQ53_14035 [bacterium]